MYTEGILSSHSQVLDKKSFYNSIRAVGGAKTPFFSSLHKGGKFEGKVSGGHYWGYRPVPMRGEKNAYAEGSKRANITHWSEVQLCNHLQIFKKTSGITRSESKAMSEDGQQRKIDKDQLANRKQMALDIEFALLGEQAPVKANTKEDVRKLGGIKHYIPATAIIDANGDALSIENHVDESTRIMSDNGIEGKILIMAGSDVFKDMQYLLKEMKAISNGETTINNRVTHVTNAWFTNVQLVANNNLKKDEFLVYAPNLIKIVLLDSVKDQNCSDPMYDVKVTEDIMELTLRSEDPHGCLWIKNVGRK
jgi:hypothetical protein